MRRDERLTLRLGEREREAIKRLAELERLPASTLARALLLKEAERLGVVTEKEGAMRDERK